MSLYHVHITNGEDDSSLLVKTDNAVDAVKHFMTHYELDTDEIDGELMVYFCEPETLKDGPVGWSDLNGMKYVGRKPAADWLAGGV